MVRNLGYQILMSKGLLECNEGYLIADANDIAHTDYRGSTIWINLSPG